MQHVKRSNDSPREETPMNRYFSIGLYYLVSILIVGVLAFLGLSWLEDSKAYLEMKVKTEVPISEIKLQLTVPSKNSGDAKNVEKVFDGKLKSSKIYANGFRKIQFPLPSEKIGDARVLFPAESFSGQITEIRVTQESFFGLAEDIIARIPATSLRGEKDFYSFELDSAKKVLSLKTTSKTTRAALCVNLPNLEIIQNGSSVSFLLKVFVAIALVFLFDLLPFAPRYFWNSIRGKFSKSKLIAVDNNSEENSSEISRVQRFGIGVSKFLFWSAFGATGIIFLISVFYDSLYWWAGRRGVFAPESAILDFFGAAVLFLLSLFAIGRINATDIVRKRFEFGAILFVFFVGVFFICIASAKIILSSDSASILRVAEGQRMDYLYRMQHQAFFIYICKNFNDFFGKGNYLPYHVLNLFAVCLLYFSIFKISYHFFRSNIVNILVAILLLLFSPFYFYWMLIYPDIIGLSLFITGLSFFLKIDRTSWIKNGTIAFILLIVATLVKSTFSLFLFFLLLFSVVFYLRTRESQKLVFAIIILPFLFICVNLFIRFYGENYAPKLLETTPIPKIAFIAMGLQSGSYDDVRTVEFVTSVKKLVGPVQVGGWNGFVWHLWDESLAKPKEERKKAMTQKSWDAISKSCTAFIKNPDYAFNFFCQKIAYMWADSRYVSRGIANPRDVYDYGGLHLRMDAKTPSAALKTFMNPKSEFSKSVEFLSGGWQFLIYFFSMFGFFCLARDKYQEKNGNALLGAIVVSGGFVFYLFWEVMPRFALPFIPFLVITAAYGIVRLSQIISSKKPA